MKNARITLDDITKEISDKINSSKDALTLFVNFIAEKRQLTDDNEKKGIRKLAKSTFGLPGLVKSLNEEDLQDLKGFLNLRADAIAQHQEVRGMPADSEAASASTTFEFYDGLYKDLVLFCDLPVRFDALTIDQKTEVYKIYKEIHKDDLDKLSIKNYDRVKRDIEKKLFFIARYALFEKEDFSDAMEITTKFPNKLMEKLISTKNLLPGDMRYDIIKDKAKGSIASLNKKIKFEGRIKYMMIEQGLVSIGDALHVKENPTKSASNTYIVVHNGKKYYAKTFDEEMSSNDKINPKEMFLYKLIEYVGFGPKSDFLIKPGSGHGPSVNFSKGNFILTEDVAVNGNEFLLDTAENKEDIKKFADCNSKEFAIEISSASVLADILSIVDVFGKNFKNYGLVGKPESPNEFKLQFIDYQYQDGSTGEKNDSLKRSAQRPYSPRQSLVDKHRDKEKLSPIAELALKTRSGENGYSKDEIRSDVLNRLFGMQEGAQDRQYMMLPNAIAEAKDYVLQKVSLAEENFMANPDALLQEYIAEIEENIGIYREGVCANDSSDFNPSCN